jgi:hypothetical protein
MSPKRFGLSVLTISATLVVLAFDGASARAGGPLNLVDKHGAKWQATWDPPNSILNLTGPTATGAGIGTLTKIAVFKPGVTSMTITFTQMTASAMPDNVPGGPNFSPGNDFGLRFTLDEVVTNDTGKNRPGSRSSSRILQPMLLTRT